MFKKTRIIKYTLISIIAALIIPFFTLIYRTCDENSIISEDDGWQLWIMVQDCGCARSKWGWPAPFISDIWANNSDNPMCKPSVFNDRFIPTNYSIDALLTFFALMTILLGIEKIHSPKK